MRRQKVDRRKSQSNANSSHSLIRNTGFINRSLSARQVRFFRPIDWDQSVVSAFGRTHYILALNFVSVFGQGATQSFIYLGNEKNIERCPVPGNSFPVLGNSFPVPRNSLRDSPFRFALKRGDRL